MKKRSFRHRIMRTMAAIAIGGSAFQLSGCDQAVRDTILSGLEETSQTLSASLISAFFQTLGDDPVT
jgi:hypothetical protein